MRLNQILFIFLICGFIGSSCKQKVDIKSIPKDASTIIHKSIDFADPAGKYSKLKKIEYTKITKLYNDYGGMEDSIFQYHSYTLKPKLSGSIEWNKTGTEHRIQYENGSATKYVNDELIQDSLESSKAFNSMMASVYVMMMPFKLTDPGAHAIYEGEGTFAMVGIGDVVHISYDTEKNDNHTKNDLWWYYFDPFSSKFIANKVDHGNGRSLIINNKDQEVDGIRFHAYRKSYNLDPAGQVERLRAEYFYDQITLEFDN